LRITVVCDILGEENNGTTITAKRLIEGLNKRGHDVRIISASEPTQSGHYQVPTYNFGRRINRYVEKNGVVIAKSDPKILKEAIDGSDVVHVLLPFSLGKHTIDYCTKNNVPVTVGMHAQAENITSHLFLKNSRFVNFLVYVTLKRLIYRHADAIHCPSQFIATKISRYKYQPRRYVISNGVIDLFHPNPQPKPNELKDKIVILFIGRYVREKRQDKLIKAVKKSKYANKIQLIFAGSGPEKDYLIWLGRKLKNKPIFAFYPKEELVKVINYADLYVHPSDAEIEGISCLEAISCGLVPIISDSPESATNAFALSKYNLFKHRCVKDLARKIDYWIDHPEQKKKASNRYVKYAQRFAIDGSIDKMVKMFDDVINSRK
jgi:1,2-diacylglycerol 3-alpha-glucosyltransferase